MFCRRSELFFDDQEFSDFSKLESLNCIHLDRICDVQEIRGFDESAYRLNQTKLMDWLNAKVQKLSQFLINRTPLLSDKESLFTSVGIIIEYLDEHTEQLFLDHLK
jgi:hypothetical protein